MKISTDRVQYFLLLLHEPSPRFQLTDGFPDCTLLDLFVFGHKFLDLLLYMTQDLVYRNHTTFYFEIKSPRKQKLLH